MRNLKQKSKTLGLISLFLLLNIRNIESSYSKEKEISIYDQMISYLTYKLDLTKNPIVSPLKITKKTHITSLFGYRIHPITHELKFHDGVDLSGKKGTPIYSTGFGTVIEVKYSKSYGRVIKIQHNDTIETVYAHLDSVFVNVNDTVYQNQKIGTMGNSGLSTGVHLHYEIRVNNKPQNPLKFFNFFNDNNLLANK